MKKHVCHWWIGYVLANPLRRLLESPERLLGPHVRRGMTVLDIGSGMGFFTLPLARMVGPEGRVVAVDLQPEMLRGLEARARRASVSERITSRACTADSLGVADLRGRIHLVLAFHMVHEVPDAGRLFAEIEPLLVPGGRVIVAEPPGHVSAEAFAATLQTAREHGLHPVARLAGKPDHSAVLARLAATAGRSELSPDRDV